MANDEFTPAFRTVEAAVTGRDGAYKFEHLGADRYFVFAHCPEEQAGLSWEPAVYPNAKSILSAEEITLLPGARRANVDFYMHRDKSYKVEGKFIFGDKTRPKPKMNEFGFDNLQLELVRLDKAPGSVYRQGCRSNYAAETFHCDSLLPGTYSLYFDLSNMYDANWRLADRQVGQVNFTVRAGSKQPPLTVVLHGAPRSPDHAARETKTGGSLNFQRACKDAMNNGLDVAVLALGRFRTQTWCSFSSFVREPEIRLPEIVTR